MVPVADTLYSLYAVEKQYKTAQPRELRGGSVVPNDDPSDGLSHDGGWPVND